jgi:hypothetical protein
MVEDLNKSITIKCELSIVISSQARKILSCTDYSEDDFIDWCLNTQKISFGGHNVMLFLESKVNNRGTEDDRTSFS